MSNPADAPELDLSRISQDLQLRKLQVEAVVQLLEEGHTPSFIARYRRERIHGLDEMRIRVIRERISELRRLAERKQTILKSVEIQGKLTDSFRQAIGEAETLKRVEDLYLPYKPKRKSLAQDARDKGLEELAWAIWNRDPAVANLNEVIVGMVNPEKGLNSPDDVLAGVKQLLTEIIGESADVRAPVRFALWETGRVIAKRAEPKPEKQPEPPPAPVEPPSPAAAPEGEAPPAPTAAPAAPEKPRRPRRERPNDEKKAEEYREYFEYTEGLRAIPPHRILAVNRGERERVLQSRLDWEVNHVKAAARSKIKLADHPHRDLLEPLVDEALALYVTPSLEKEIRRELTEEALGHAIEIFARNFRSLLLTPPVRNHRVLAIDPGVRMGTKAVALDEQGTPLEDVTVHPLPPQNQVAEAKAALAGLILKNNISLVAIGNGSMYREMEQLVSDLIQELETPVEGRAAVTNLSYAVVNEAGAADYADGPAAREELPNVDRMTRGAISIGRRIQDPIVELVKVDPQLVGIGLYQNDVKPKHMKDSIDEVIESCVNEVGVDLNAATAATLRFVSGLNPAAAQEIVQYRKEKGPFRSRAQLLEIPSFTPLRFQQAAPFLKISNGDDPLDATWVHPENYTLARQILAEAGFVDGDLRDPEKLAGIRAKLANENPAETAARLSATEPAVRVTLDSLSDPFHDPRETRTPPVLKKRMLKLEDLTTGMELRGTVVNVVPFGAFVDIGLKETGLVHISRLASRYIRNAHEVVAVGDVVSVWVLEVDKERKRALLTMVKPGTERKPEPRPAFQAPPPRPPRQERPQQQRQDRPQPPRPSRPAGPPPQRQPQDRAARFQPRPPRPPQEAPPPPKPAKPKALPKLSTDALTGKSPLGSFAELEAFFKVKDEPTTTPPTAPPPAPPETPKTEEGAASPPPA